MKAASTERIEDFSDKELREDLHRRFSERGLRRRRFKRFAHSVSWVVLVQSLAFAKRASDLLVAYILFRIFSPVLLLTFLVLKVKGVAIKRTPKLGRWCETFDEFSFAIPDTRTGRILKKLKVERLPVLMNIVKGNMSFIGPRAVSPGEISLQERAARKRHDVRPGLLCLWWIRGRANIDYGSEFDSDAEYVDTHSMWNDLTLTLRAIPAVLYGQPAGVAPDQITILGLRVNNLTMTEAIDSIVERLDRDAPSQVSFVNADCVNIAYRDADYCRKLNGSQITLADGIGMKLAGKLLGREIRQNINGTDLFPRLCEKLAGTEKGIFLLGARAGVTESVRDWIARNNPGVPVSGYHHGYFSAGEEREVINQIRESGAAMLLVAFGAPRQDKWISEHLAETGVKVAIGVGGLFDFYSGRIQRAPQWMREMGFEWLYRFYQEPGRMWRRYFVGNAVFLFRVIKERISGRRDRA